MKYAIVLLCWLFSLLSHAQEGTFQFPPVKISTQKNGNAIANAAPREIPYEYIPHWAPSPIQAALYSTIFPGLGQAYNKKYWKIPLVWGLLVGGFYSVAYNQKHYDKWHGLYIDAINRIPKANDYTAEQLARIQAQIKKNYSYALLFTVVVYNLNILDALVDAHLYEIDHDKDLSINPTIIPSVMADQPALGLSLHLKL